MPPFTRSMVASPTRWRASKPRVASVPQPCSVTASPTARSLSGRADSSSGSTPAGAASCSSATLWGFPVFRVAAGWVMLPTTSMLRAVPGTLPM